MNQRFNFFLLFVGLVLNAAVNSKDSLWFRGTLTAGFIFAALLFVTIFRAHCKVNTVFTYLRNHDRSHPIVYMDQHHDDWWRARRLLGAGIPAAAVLILFFLALGAWVGFVSAPRSNEREEIEKLAREVQQMHLAVTNNHALTAIQQSLITINSEMGQTKAALADVAQRQKTLTNFSSNRTERLSPK